MGLIKESEKMGKMKLLETETFKNTFDGKRKKKYMKNQASSLESLMSRVQQETEQYDTK